MTENFGNSQTTENPDTTATTQAPEPPPAPTQGVNTDALRDVRSWRRAVGPDRKVAGVSAGIGRALNVDPTLIRVLFVVLAFANGFGLLVYLVAWLLMPEEGTDEPVFKSSNWVRSALVFSAAVLAAVIGIAAFGALWAIGTPGSPNAWPLVPVALVVIAIVWLSSRRESHGGHASQSAGESLVAGTVEAPAAEAGFGSPPVTPPTPTAPAVPPTPAPPRPSYGPRLFGLTMALLALGLGTLGIIDRVNGSIPDAAYPALALAIIGAMLVVGSVFGRPGGLIFIGIITTLILAGSTTAGDNLGGDHNLQAAPLTATAVQPDYKIGAGTIELDLTQVSDLQALDGRTLSIELNAGEVVVLVPSDLGVNVNAEVRYGGQIDLTDQTADGWDVQLSQHVNPNADTQITLDILVRFGHVEVRHA